MFLHNIYESVSIAAQIELRMTQEEAECVHVALALLKDDLAEMPIPYRDEAVRNGARIVTALLETLERALEDHALKDQNQMELPYGAET